MQYVLTAELKGKKQEVRFIAEDNNDATFSAMDYILNAAKRRPLGVWARGRITLVDPNGVNVQEPMEAK